MAFMSCMGCPQAGKSVASGLTGGLSWTRLYSPLAGPPPKSFDTLRFISTLDGGAVTDPGASRSPVVVPSSDPDNDPNADNRIELKWVAGGQILEFETFEHNFTIDELAALANGSTPE
jgi:hypothetical protein